jgi:hypothetical protein
MRATFANPPKRAARAPWIAALAAGVLCFAIGYAVLSTGHPHEDAYILFRYAEHLAQGRGIVFNAQGPRAEGATDFLWLAGIAALVRGGSDVALAALALSALGTALTAWLFVRCAQGSLVLGLAGIAYALAFSGALAGYVGFSSALYSGVTAACLWIWLCAEGWTLAWLPVVGLVLGLIRPDGVICGVGFALLGLVRARATGGLRPYVGALALCAVVGVVYFAWRAQYFGLLLPLPLYVKSHSNVSADAFAYLPDVLRAAAVRMQGLEPTLRWIVNGQGPLPLAAGLAVLAARLWPHERTALRRAAAGLLPLGALLGAFAFSWQSQNISFRFQAPIALGAALLVVSLAARLLARETRPALRLAAILGVWLCFAPTLYYGALRVRDLLEQRGREYVEGFAPALGARLEPSDTVVLTEAGRVAYFTSARVEDMAGLNDPASARIPASLERVRALAPDVVLYHHGATLDVATLTSASPGRPVVRVEPEVLARAVRPEARDLFEHGAASYADAGGRAHLVAAGVLTRYLAESREHTVFAVDYRANGRYDHVLGVRPERWTPQDVEAALLAACRFEGHLSYLDLQRAQGRERRERFARGFVASLAGASELYRSYARPADLRRLEALRPRLARDFALLADRDTPLGPAELLLRFSNGERGALYVDERAREIVAAELMLYPVEAP